MLSGCSIAADPAAETTPTPAPTFPSQPLSGTGIADGSAEIPLAVPPGAQSLVIDFGCVGADHFFMVEFGDSMAEGTAPLVGNCGGVHQLALSVDADSGPLRVLVPDGVRWVGRATFSADEFHSDPALTDDCATYSSILSLLTNADQGFSHYDDLDEAEWRARVAEGSTRLADAGSASETMLGDLFTDLGTSVGDPARVVGESLGGSRDTATLIARICDANQSQLVIMGEYGG